MSATRAIFMANVNGCKLDASRVQIVYLQIKGS